MFPCDDDSPPHVDRFDCPTLNPQARRMHRHNQESLSAGDRTPLKQKSQSSTGFKKDRTTPQGLNDRIYIPKDRRPAAMQPVPMHTWQ